MAELCVQKNSSAVISCLGLGSCIGVFCYDPITKIGGVAHLVLPDSQGSPAKSPSPKYVDIGIPMLLQQMCKEGANKARIIAKIVGGSQMSLSRAAATNPLFNIGERNAVMAKTVLANEGIPLIAADVGGHAGRTAKLFLDSGKLTVKSSGGEEKEL